MSTGTRQVCTDTSLRIRVGGWECLGLRLLVASRTRPTVTPRLGVCKLHVHAACPEASSTLFPGAGPLEGSNVTESAEEN